MILPQRLGHGGFAVVHLAIDLLKRRQVACKVRFQLSAAYADAQADTSTPDYYESDAQAHSTRSRCDDGARSPRYPQLYDVLEINGQLHLFLQLVTGGDLFQCACSQYHDAVVLIRQQTSNDGTD